MLLCASVPEWSSLTSEDTVLVMESAATSRSFLRFLLGPAGDKTSICSSSVAHHMSILCYQHKLLVTQCNAKLK